MMIVLTGLMVALLGYQVTMPAVDNGRYSFHVYEGRIVRMNTQDGSFAVCDQTLTKCEAVETK